MKKRYPPSFCSRAEKLGGYVLSGSCVNAEQSCVFNTGGKPPEGMTQNIILFGLALAPFPLPVLLCFSLASFACYLSG